MRRTAIVIVILTLATLSCAPIYRTVVVKEFASEQVQKVSLVIAPLKNVVVDYFGNVKDEFGEGDQKTLILNHFKEKLPIRLYTQSKFDPVTFDTFKEEPQFRAVSYDMGDMFKLNVSVPTDSTAIEFENSVPDFVLFIEDLFIGVEMMHDNYGFGFGYNSTPNKPGFLASEVPENILYFQPPTIPKNPNPMQNMHMNRTPKTKYLRYKCDFIIWDNRHYKVVAYGRTFSKSKAQGFPIQVIRMFNWYECDKKFVNDLVYGTPFQQ